MLVQASTFSKAIFIETFVKELCKFRGGNADLNSNSNSSDVDGENINNGKTGSTLSNDDGLHPVRSWHREVVRQCSRNPRKNSSQIRLNEIQVTII